MAKIKFTKGELKRQRDALKQYRRYLPTLQLKKQQLQAEILQVSALLEQKKRLNREKTHSAAIWASLLSDRTLDMRNWLKGLKVVSSTRNVAGVDLPVFETAHFDPAEYDLFTTPLWVDNAVDMLRGIISLRAEVGTMEESIKILRQELRITTQRVNLFEKVKIPEAEDAIRLIKIFIGDQMANAVGRSKIAKKKIEKAFSEEMIAGIS